MVSLKGVNMKTALRSVSFFLCFLFLILPLSSCNHGKSKEKFTKTYFDYFDTVTTVIGYAESEEEFLKTAERIESLMAEYHKLYDIYHSSSDSDYEDEYSGVTNIKDINSIVNGQHPVCKVDRKIIDLLLYCKQVYQLTNGETNVAMGSVLKLWHDEREKASTNPQNAALPDIEALRNAFMHVDISDVIIDEENSTVFLSDPEMSLDVGAVAKGYATEMIARELSKMGITGYALNVGGNVRTIGKKPGGSEWSIGIENPDPFEPYLETVSVSDKAVVTSGSYHRYYTVDGKNYHHIIDKETLYPSAHFQLVSVITDNSALADALSTALFCMPLEDGKALVESLEGIEAFWLSNDGAKSFSSGFSKYQ